MAHGSRRRGRSKIIKERELDEKIGRVLDSIKGVTANAKQELAKILKNQIAAGTIDIKKIEQVIRSRGKQDAILSGLKAQGIKFEVSGLPQKERPMFQLRPIGGSSTRCLLVSRKRMRLASHLKGGTSDENAEYPLTFSSFLFFYNSIYHYIIYT